MTHDYTHGPKECRACFTDTNEEILQRGDWRLHNNPGYYGSSTPEILVLGFSKGANQNKEAEKGNFDQIAFAGARHRLQIILETLNLMPKDRSVDSLMTAKETQFGIASLVRCSFCKMKNGICKTSGDVVPSAFTNADTLAIINTCVSKHLGKLPSSVKLIILLGTSESYIKKTTALIKSLYPDFEQDKTNSVAFQAGGALWVYATHPSPGNGYFNAWISNDENDKSGNKRILALEALTKYL